VDTDAGAHDTGACTADETGAPAADAANGSAAAAATDTSVAASAATTASAAVAATKGQSLMLSERGRPGIFLVEDIEGRQANVGEFLLTKKEFVIL